MACQGKGAGYSSFGRIVVIECLDDRYARFAGRYRPICSDSFGMHRFLELIVKNPCTGKYEGGRCRLGRDPESKTWVVCDADG